LVQLGRFDEAAGRLQQVLAENPNDPEAQKNMGWILATCPEGRIRDRARAVQLAERADQLTSPAIRLF
jgi:Flp pilus assembly protein TadD